MNFKEEKLREKVILFYFFFIDDTVRGKVPVYIMVCTATWNVYVCHLLYLNITKPLKDKEKDKDKEKHSTVDKIFSVTVLTMFCENV